MKRKRSPTAVRELPPGNEPAPVAASAARAPDKPLDALDALSKAQEGLGSAEAFWKSAGRFCRLR